MIEPSEPQGQRGRGTCSAGDHASPAGSLYHPRALTLTGKQAVNEGPVPQVQPRQQLLHFKLHYRLDSCSALPDPDSLLYCPCR